MESDKSHYHGHRFPPESSATPSEVCHRFCMSLRDVEDLLAERGIIVSYEAIRIWCKKFGSEYARDLKQHQGGLGDANDPAWSSPQHGRYANNRIEASHQ